MSLPGIEPELAARLPHLHEQQERQETQNVLTGGLGEELGVHQKTWEGGLWSVRCGAEPNHGPGNQLIGLTLDPTRSLEQLDALLRTVTPWFDEAACSMRIRVLASRLNQAMGSRLAGLGFAAEEVEAWMASPIDALNVDAAAHDIRPAETPQQLDDFAQAFCGGWEITSADKQRIATAAMAIHPPPEGWRRYVVYVGGEPAGEAVLVMFDGVGYLAEAATKPEFRRRGIQRALIARRIEDARAEGAKAMFSAVQYGDQSWGNMRSIGLSEANMTVTFRRPAGKSVSS